MDPKRNGLSEVRRRGLASKAMLVPSSVQDWTRAVSFDLAERWVPR